MLQARIIEVTDSGKEELETIIDAVYNQWWFNYSSAGAGAGYVYADQPANYNPQTGDNRPAPLAPITRWSSNAASSAATQAGLGTHSASVNRTSPVCACCTPKLRAAAKGLAAWLWDRSSRRR